MFGGPTVGCEAADHVLVDLIYNLGTTRLSKFKNMRRAIANKDWNRAADEVVDSTYCRQVGRRCTRNANQIRSCAN